MTVNAKLQSSCVSRARVDAVLLQPAQLASGRRKDSEPKYITRGINQVHKNFEKFYLL